MDYNKLGLDADLIKAVAAITEASCSSKKMEKEELHPNQKVLDKNKNGKLDAHDFKLLRKEEEDLEEAKDGWSQNDSLAKPVTSSQAMANHSQYFTKVTKLDSDGNPKKPEKLRKEELDELSKKTLGSYVNKAANDVSDKSSDAADAWNKREHKRGFAAGKQVDKRLAGISKATGKLTKEQVEEIEMLAAKHGLGE